MGRGKKPMTEEQKDSLQKRIDGKKAQVEKMQQKVDAQEKSLQDLKKALQEADIMAQTNPEKYDKNFDIASANEQRQNLVNENQETKKEIDKINAEKQDMIKEFNGYVTTA